MHITKALRASCEQSQAGYHNDEGLPNIAGSFSCQKCGVYSDITATGPFSASSTSLIGSGDGRSGTNIKWNFDASRTNNIYGSSNSVMPESIDISCIIYLGR